MSINTNTTKETSNLTTCNPLINITEADAFYTSPGALINELLEESGHNLYWLYEQTDINLSLLQLLINGETNLIEEQAQAISKALNFPINDLLEFNQAYITLKTTGKNKMFNLVPDDYFTNLINYNQNIDDLEE